MNIIKRRGDEFDFSHIRFKVWWNGKHLKPIRNVNLEFEMGQARCILVSNK